MSNLPTIVPTTDLTDADLEKVAKYVERGLPGVSEVTSDQLYRMYELYLSGSTYSQIASMLAVKRIIVLYFSHANKWFDTKSEYLSEVQDKIKNRIVDTKLRNKEFMLLLVQAWQRKIGGKLNKYLATGDSQHMDEIDLKEVAQLMKAIDMVNELDESGKNPQGKTPAIGLNMGGNGVTVERTGDNAISITPNAPKEESLGDMLQKYADESRKKEKVAIAPPSNDINNNTKGENNEIE